MKEDDPCGAAISFQDHRRDGKSTRPGGREVGTSARASRGSGGGEYVGFRSHDCSTHAGHIQAVAKRREMAGDLLLFPGRQGGIENGVHRKVLLATREPGRRVVKTHDGEQRQCCPMNACLEWLTRSALQH